MDLISNTLKNILRTTYLDVKLKYFIFLLIITFTTHHISLCSNILDSNGFDVNLIIKNGDNYVLSEFLLNDEKTLTDSQKRLEFALVKGVDPAYIVLARSEHSGVHAAAKDLQRDITKITGVTPNIVHSLKETSGRCVVIGSADCLEGKELLASVGVSVDDLEGKWELFKYQILNDVGDKEQVLAIAGSNLRGTIFGIYDFEQKHLEVDPLWFWADHEPPARGELIFDDRINFSSLKEPTWKYRGWTLNDHPQLIEWMQTGLVQRARYGRYMFVIHPEVFERFYEAALRLKMNMFTWYFIDADWQPDRDQLRRTVERGLFITQQQAEPLGANYGYWDHYWDNHDPQGKPDMPSYLLYPEKFQQFWAYYINRWSEFSPHVVWEVDFRGWADAAYTEPTLPDGGTPEELSKIVNQALKDQSALVRNYDKNPDLQMMTTLYGEVGRYYDSGWVEVPAGVTTGFSDAGMSGMSHSKKFWTEKRDPNRKYGQYFHTNYFGGGPQVAKCTPIDTYLKVNMDAMYERGDTQHMLLAMNELRCQQLEIRGIAEMLWDYPEFEYNEYLLRYCRENFGNEAAPEVAALYEEYYKKYPHEMRNDGNKTYAVYYKVMEPLFTIIANLLNIESGNTDGWVMNYQYKREIYKKGIKDLGEVLEKAIALRPSIPENRKYFFDYEFLDAIKLIRGIYKLSIATQDAISFLEKGNHSAALKALLDAQPLTIELYEAFSNQKGTDKWKYWYRSSTNKDFYLMYNLYQKARLHLETETMNVVTNIQPQRRPYRGNVVMHDPAKVGDAIYGAQAERINNAVWNGSMHSVLSFPLQNTFQINGVQSVAGKGKWLENGTDYGKSYSFTLQGRAEVYVAFQQGSKPEWLNNFGFKSTGLTMEAGKWNWPYRYRDRPADEVHVFEIFSKEFPAGDVVLGKNKELDESLKTTVIVSGASTQPTEKHDYEAEKNLPYIVFIKPDILAYENFRNTEFNSQPAEWEIVESGGFVKVVDIPDYDGELRPSIFDLTTVPRYTPLDLRGLKLETLKPSTSPSTAELTFNRSVNDNFIIDIRLKTGQNNQRTGFSLLSSDGENIIEVIMNERGNIAFKLGKSQEESIKTYEAGRWYNIKLNIFPSIGIAEIEIQDDNLNLVTRNNLKTKISRFTINRLKLIHENKKEGAWIIYNAISAYLK